MAPIRHLPTFLLVAALSLGSHGCLYRAGSGLMAGILDESAGRGRSGGVSPIVDTIVERALLAELGSQLGQGLQAGVTDITPEQRASLEATVDGLVTLALLRAGEGLRREVSPELRSLVRRDIVETFAEGLRSEITPSLEELADRVVTRTVVSLRRNLDAEETRMATADLMRDSVYMSMRESMASPSISETLRVTLTQDVLEPLSYNVDSLSNNIAGKVDAQAQRGERTLQAVIGALVLILGVGTLVFITQRRQFRRQQRARPRRRSPLAKAMAALPPDQRAAAEQRMMDLLRDRTPNEEDG